MTKQAALFFAPFLFLFSISEVENKNILLQIPQLSFQWNESDTLKETHQTDTISIIGVGDIMLGTNFPSASYLPPNDGKDLLNPVKDILLNATVTFGNLEGVLLTEEGDVKKCQNPAVCYAFKSPDYYVNYIKDAGFDVLSVANNHIGDFGNIGRENTVRLLDSASIAFAGLEKYPYSTFERDGVKFGFCAFAPNTGTQKINDYNNARQIIQHLDSICDVVIVSFHGGAEGANYKRITRKKELFLGEDRGNPYEFSRVVINAGADIVFGHGPHLTRAIDLYNDRFIAYSLGNFATYGRFNLKGSLGVAPIVKVFTDKNGKFIEAKIISIKQEGEGGPTLDETNKAIQEIKQLTELDIPEVRLSISDDGTVKKK